tara:strand:- start:160 stop:534 length:375 start_codon:yes stop_codon:yes gene_type:complete
MATVNLDIAQTVDITCRRGDTFALDFNFKNAAGNAALDITSYTFKMEVREDATDDSGSPTISSVNIVCANEVPTSGVVSVSISNTSMAAVEGGSYVYDLQATAAGGTTTWVTGSFEVNEDVTIG